MKRKFTTLIATTLIIGMMSTPVWADEKDDRIAELEAQVADLQLQLEEALAKIPQSTDQESYKIGETWVVEGLWKVTLDSVTETDQRNAYADTTPEAVYILKYTYENLGYESDDMNGLFISLDTGIIDTAGKMGYSYPGDVTYYAQETPVGATCEAEVCIGVDNAGDFKINYTGYDAEYNEYEAVFEVEVG